MKRDSNGRMRHSVESRTILFQIFCCQTGCLYPAGNSSKATCRTIAQTAGASDAPLPAAASNGGHARLIGSPSHAMGNLESQRAIQLTLISMRRIKEVV